VLSEVFIFLFLIFKWIESNILKWKL
jgi:hypothetical protein